MGKVIAKPYGEKRKPKAINKKEGEWLSGGRQKRTCLKCGKKFPSKGPYNRICDKCSLMNERVSASTYVVRNNLSTEQSDLEKRFYGFN